MKRVLSHRLIDDFEERINKEIPNNITPNDIIDASSPFTFDTASFYEFKNMY
jgi:hypothetical protein